MARSAAAGKRAQSAPSADLKSARLARSRKKARAAAQRSALFRAACRSRHAGSAGERRNRRLLRAAIRSAWESSAPSAANRAQKLRTGLPLDAFASSRRNDRQRDRSVGPAIGPARPSGISASRTRKTARTSSSSNRRFPIIGRKRRRFATPTCSSCRGLPICGGAATRWCWNRRAPARCSKFAIRRSRPRSRCLPTPQPIKQLRRQDGFPGLELLALLVDCQILFKVDAADEMRSPSGRRRRQSCSLGLSRSAVPRAQHGRPACQSRGRSLSACAGVIGPLPAVRPRWPGKQDRSAQVLGRASGANLAARRSFCASAIRPATSTTSSRSRSPSFRSFSTAPRASSRNAKAPLDPGDGGPAVTYTSAVSIGGRELRAGALSCRRHCEGLAARILSLRRRRTCVGADRRRVRRSSKRC